MRMLDDLAPWGKRDRESINGANVVNESIATDVEGIKSDAAYMKGFVKFPIFDVSESEFRENMEPLRQRCKFVTEKVVNYIEKTRFSTPFYIRMKDANDQEYLRKIS